MISPSYLCYAPVASGVRPLVCSANYSDFIVKEKKKVKSYLPSSLWSVSLNPNLFNWMSYPSLAIFTSELPFLYKRVPFLVQVVAFFVQAVALFCTSNVLFCASGCPFLFKRLPFFVQLHRLSCMLVPLQHEYGCHSVLSFSAWPADALCALALPLYT